MKVVVTGARGFLGSRVVDYLLSEESPIKVTELLITGSQLPSPRDDPRVKLLAVDLTSPDAADRLVQHDTDVFFHMAAVVSGHAEAEFDYGLKVNFEATKALLEAARHRVPSLRFVFTSAVAVFGGDLPPVVDDITAVMPQNTYGTAKAMSELLVNDYSRRGFVDGRILRVPTISVRPGAPNRAMTSFASGIIREPLNGVPAVCPVPPEQELWLSSPRVVVKNIVHAATLPKALLGLWRCVTLPGICVSVKEMVDALYTVAGKKVADLVRFEKDDVISQVVASFPSRFDTTRALNLGFDIDTKFVDFVRHYVRDNLKTR
ncbi:D-erythronate dehydrogenase [Bombyx mori]|uniref:NAD-dependent epimerase/dehydratase domain-containing protein n=1 Tax=Bombyx mori TaxID=7091 RepID=A0A8R1WKB9_BOMMO|nr:D-erythronate dehydrogenase [Bombyx mori]